MDFVVSTSVAELLMVFLVALIVVDVRSIKIKICKTD